LPPIAALPERNVAVTAITAAAELGGTERVLLDVATRAFEFGVTLRVLAPREGPLLARCRALGIPSAVVPMPPALLRGSQRARHLHTLPAALAGLTRWRRAVQAHDWVRTADVLYPVGFKPYLGATGAGVPAVWHLHEMPPAATGWYWRRRARTVPRAVIASSRAIATAWRLDAQVIRNGVDLDVFRPRPATGWIHDLLGIDRSDRLVGMPAVFAAWKGQLVVAEAFRRVRHRFPDAHLVFVGGSIYDTVTERAFAARLRAVLGERIHLVPFQEHVELVYPELTLGVHYSLRPEPFGRVVLEAMACGVPILAAAEGGPTEIVTEGGWLVPPRNPEALAGALADALGLSAEQRTGIGRWGRVRAEDGFSARDFARKVCAALHA
jgi:glycosyltransferase involved in cell wall biosynthesis